MRIARSLVSVSVLVSALAVSTDAAAAPTAHADRPSAAVSQQPGTFVAVAPAHERIADTRRAADHLTRPGARGTLQVSVLGSDALPGVTGVSAVQVNVTAVKPAAGGYLTVYAAGTTRPGTSSVSFAAGETRASAAITRVGSNGRIAIYNGSAGSTDVLVDVTGYYVAGTASVPGSLATLTPARVLDTRSAFGGTTPGPAGTVKLQLPGRGGVPASGVAAVALTVTVTGAERNGYVVAHAGGTARPQTSNIAFAAGRTVGNQIIAEVGGDGTVELDNRSTGRIQLVADVAGYYLSGTATTAGAYVPVKPTRLSDSRLTATSNSSVPALGHGSLPAAKVAAFVMNVTSTEVNREGGYLTVDVLAPRSGGENAEYVDGSLLNYALHSTTANLGIAPTPVGPSTFIAQYPIDSTAIIVDVSGYFLQDPGTAAGAISGRLTDAASGALIKDASVSVFDARDGSLVASGDASYTDDNGDFLVFGVPASATGYDVCVTPYASVDAPTGYIARCYDGVVWSLADQDANRPASGSQAVPVQAGEVASGVDIGLTPGGAIAGRLTTTDGSAMAGIYLDVYEGSAFRSALGGVTQRDGSYLIKNLPPGTDYAICSGIGPYGELPTDLPRCYADAPYRRTVGRPAGAQPITVRVGQVTRADIALPPGGAIAGRVTAAATGAPLVRELVTAYTRAGAFLTSTKTDSEGEYTLEGLEPGSDHVVCFYHTDTLAGECYDNAPYPLGAPTSAATPVTVTGYAATTRGIDAALSPS